MVELKIATKVYNKDITYFINIVVMENNQEDISALTPDTPKKFFLFQISTLSKVLAVIIFIMVSFVVFFLGIEFSKYVSMVTTSNITATQDTISTTSDSESLNQESISKSGEAVLIYSETISLESQERTWPTLNIWKKIAEQSPQLIATVGGVGEYPSDFAVSHDKKYLAVNLESKLILINLETKGLRTIFTPKSIVGGKIAFSPDSTKIAVADGSYYVSSNHNALYSIDVVSGTTTLLDQREGIEYDGIESWRPDNKLILALKVPKGGDSYAGKVFDLSTKELTPLTVTGMRSADGMLLAQSISSSKDDICKYSEGSWWGDFRASFSSEYAIIDPVTQSKKGTIVAPEKIIQPVTFSKDNNEVLYRVIDLSKKIEDCANYLSAKNPIPYIYYTKDLTTGKVSIVNDYKSILSNWHANTINAVSHGFSIEIDGVSIVTKSIDKPNDISIIAQFYK